MGSSVGGLGGDEGPEGLGHLDDVAAEAHRARISFGDLVDGHGGDAAERLRVAQHKAAGGDWATYAGLIATGHNTAP